MSKRQNYPSDLTDAQWALIRPLLPKAQKGRPGRPRKVNPRDILDGIFYVLRSGCQWRMLPHDFPPWGTVACQFYRWRTDGLWPKLHHALYGRVREQEGHRPRPSAGGYAAPSPRLMLPVGGGGPGTQSTRPVSSIGGTGLSVSGVGGGR